MAKPIKKEDGGMLSDRQMNEMLEGLEAQSFNAFAEKENNNFIKERLQGCPTMSLEVGGKFETREDMVEALQVVGQRMQFWLGEGVGGMITSEDNAEFFPLSEKSADIDLIFVTPEQLNLGKEATVDEVLKQARIFGLELCPPEVGPYLRLRYTNQGTEAPVAIGMDKLVRTTEHDRLEAVFTLQATKHHGLVLGSASSKSKAGHMTWAFIKPPFMK